MAQLQLGACAFAASCVNPGERQLLPGTNRTYCPVHIHAMEMPSAGSNGGTEFAPAQFHRLGTTRSKRRSNWLTFSGTAGVY